MADVTKLKKQFQKLHEQVAERRAELNAAVDAFAAANRLLAAVEERLEHAEAMEMALEMRGKKNAE